MRDEAAGASEGEVRAWRVEGMDCASCAAKIRGAVEDLPGVSDVQVSLTAATLRLTLAPSATEPETIEQRLRALGYGARRQGAASADAETAETPWHRTAKGRLALWSGCLLGAAWLAEAIRPEAFGPWLFVLAAAMGLLPVARRALAAARLGQVFTIEMLMTLAAGGALLIGAEAEAAAVVVLFAIGELLEGVAAGQARAGVRALAALQPKVALLEGPDGLREVPAETLRPGWRIVARPGDRIAADGVVVAGIAGVDESPVTGESVPVTKGVGDSVAAGSIVAEAALTLRVTRPVEDNTIARIRRLIEEAEAARAPTQRFIDRFARLYMPVIVGLAGLVMVGPPLLAGAEWGTWLYRGLALLLIGCPCALVISVPAAIASALSAGARRGLLMKGGAVVEAMATIRRVAFDKTGTLTAGAPVVTDVEPLGASVAAVLGMAAAVEGSASHPLAAAIRARAEAEGCPPRFTTGARAIPGRGVGAMLGESEVFVGSPALAAEMAALPATAAARASALEAEGKTVVVVFRSGTPLGLIALRDEPRPEAVAALAALRDLGVEPVMLTGDNARMAAVIGDRLGLAWQAGLLPDDKVAAVRRMAAEAPLMMVGDGINDAPALAAAQVGVAMGSGTDVALETADAALLRNRLTDVAAMRRLSQAAMANIRQNVAIALGLKAVFLVTTIAGITGLWPAILADTGATVLVTANALRLLWFDPEARVGQRLRVS
jgi:Cd2+/Zn2+-exporting ATPase